MKHIVFNSANAEVLLQAIQLDDSLQGEVLCIHDDFSIAPIIDIYDSFGYQQRKSWFESEFQSIVQTTPEAEKINDDKLTVHQLTQWLSQNTSEELWIWMAQNAKDVCGYYWLVTQLANFQGRVMILYLNNLPFINEKGNIFYPTQLHQILPKEFLKAKKLARPVTLSEFEIDSDEWKRICNENACLRVLEGGKKIVNKNDNFFDADILALCQEPIKLSKLLPLFQQKFPAKISDNFIVWRLQQAEKNGQIAISSDWQKMHKDIEISKIVVQV